MLLSVSPNLIDLDSASYADPSDFVQVGNLAYFAATDTTHGRELWATDGTEQGTYLVKDIQSGAGSSDPTEFVEFGGNLFFVADDGQNGIELWMTNGTASGTILVADINDSDTGADSSPTGLTVVDGLLYFAATDESHGTELWRSDGSAAGTVMVKDIYTGTTSSVPNSSSPVALTDVDGTLFFVAEDSANGLELWKSDGTANSTVLVSNINTNGHAFDRTGIALVAVDDTLFFVADDGQHGNELWTSDGTAAGTTLVEDIRSGSGDAFTLTKLQLVAMDGVLYFAAEDAAHGDELWRSDGTATGTYLLKDINPGASGDLSTHANLTVVNDTLFFAADDGEHGWELWKTDGTTSGTVLVEDIEAGSGNSHPTDMTSHDGVLYFSANSTAHGREIWQSDGTAAGTWLLVETAAGASGLYPSSLKVLNNHLLFKGYEASHREVYTVDLEAASQRSARLSIWVDGSRVGIGDGIGVYDDSTTADVYTTDQANQLALVDDANPTLGDFFTVWRTAAGPVGNNADATFGIHELMGHESNTEYTVQMFVNGQVCTDFDEYVIQNGDEIVLIYSDNPVVSINTNFGPLVMELYEDDTPITVENFLTYINDGDYLESIFHRSVSNFVIQGGGFTTSSDIFGGTSQFTAIPSNGQIQLEIEFPNLYGTVAMARTGDPNSATSQFFINMKDNPGNDPHTDSDGYAVFGMVLDMTSAEVIGDLPIHTDSASPFDELPYDSLNTLVVVQSIEGLGDITGYKFFDADGDGVFDSNESGIEDVTVFVDANDNGVLDDGEVWTTTDADGKYLLQALPGTHSIVAEVTPGTMATVQSVDVTVEMGVLSSDVNLGEGALPAPTGIDLVAASDTGSLSNDDLTYLNNVDSTHKLQFLVTGVNAGAEVRIYADGVEIGMATALGSTVTVTTNGQTALSDGQHQITATQSVAGNESNPSDALTVTIDTQAPAAIASEVPAIAEILVPYSFDADSPDEGQSGLTYSLEGAPSGMTIDAATGQIAWTPTAAQAEPQEFDIVVTDAAGNTSVVSVDMTVLGVIPAYPDAYETDEDVNLVVDAAGGLFANDDPDELFGDLTPQLVGSAAHGTVTINNDGSFTYKPDPNFFGTDSFTYQASDGTDETNIAKVTIVVHAVQDPPVGLADSYSTLESQKLTVGTATGVLANDTDADGETLTVTLGTGPSHGTLELAQDGSFEYTPTEGYYGADSFTYVLSDGTDTTDPITVQLTVEEVDDPPMPEDDAYSIDEDGILSVAAAEGVLVNDTDPDSTSFTLDVIDNPTYGTVSLNDDGSFTYTPNANFYGTDTFTYTVSDDVNTSAKATVTITVNAIADAPDAVNDAYNVANDGVTRVYNVLANDSDPDASDTVTILSVTQGSQDGGVAFNENGILYSPKAGFVGTETFTYTVQDADGHTDTATVTMTVSLDGNEETGTSSLSGYVFVDTDNDGTRDSGEIGIPGVLITLTGTSDAGNTVSRTRLTDGNGYYLFDNLPAGNYTITESQPDVFSDGSDSTTTSGTVGNDKFTGVDLNAGVSATANNFGEKNLQSGFITVRMFLGSTPPMAEYFRGLVAYAAQLAGNNDLAQAIRDGQTDFEQQDDNHAPVAVSDTYTVKENATLTVTAANGVLHNDTDADGDSLTAALYSGPAHGTISLDSDGSFVYTPDTNYAGTDTFSYVAYDGSDVSTKVTVTITVSEDNDAPVATADSYSTTEDGTLNVTAADGVLDNDTDADGDSLEAVLVDGPAHGTVQLEDNGSFVYTPTGNFNGTDTFTYYATDGTLDSETVTVTITVGGVNDAPVAADDAYTIGENATLDVDAASGVLDNDSDPDGDTLEAEIVSQPTHGTVALDADGSFVYIPDVNFVGTDTFTYRATDGTLDSATRTVTITVTEGNDAPVATDDSYSTDEDTILTIGIADGVLNNDSDADNDTITADLVQQPDHGSVALEDDGSFTYTPEANYSGTVTFTYRASDGTLESEEVTVTITINPVNDAPTGEADAYSVLPGGQLDIDTESGVLANDDDVEDDTLTVSLVTDVEHGTLSLDEDGSFTYIPTSGYHGLDSFTYKINDGTDDSEPITVEITVNTPPEAVADAYEVDEDVTIEITDVAEGVLDNDTDSDSDSLTASLVVGPQHGQIQFHDDGTFTYTPEENYHGTDTFTYLASDDFADSAKVTVTITINPVNDAPTGDADAYTASENVILSIGTTNGVLKNDDDVEEDALTASLVTQPEHGTVTLNTDGSFEYTPDVNYVGTDTFTYKAADAMLESDPITVTITIEEGNDVPVGVEDEYTVAVNGELNVNAADGVLANDSDDDGDTMTAELAVQTQHGTVVLEANGSFKYTPNEDFHGTDEFTYTVSDGTLMSEPITVRIDVNNPAIANNFNVSTNEDEPLTIPASIGLLTGSSDPDGDQLKAKLLVQAEHGTVVVEENGSFTYTPEENFFGTDTFTFFLDDGYLNPTPHTVTITVDPVNDAPVTQSDNYNVGLNTALVIDEIMGMLANDDDIEGDSLSVVSIVDDVQHGTLIWEADGSFTYTPADGYEGYDTFTYQVSDGQGGFTEETVTLHIDAAFADEGDWT
ncbi:MAG: tandem-95 repeat protein [Pirellulales bacterium]|nr:tandem-95 repeat protein [Pirellulales bacterium]